MADAVQVFDYRHSGLFGYAFDQTLAAARNDHVDVFRHGYHTADRGPVGGSYHLHRIGRQAGLSESGADALGYGLVGVESFRAAAQYGGVARLQTKRGCVRGNVGARFIDDPHHPKRHPHAPDLDAAGQVVHVKDAAYGIGQRNDLAQAIDHAVDACACQFQAIHQRTIQPFGGARSQILLICTGQRDVIAVEIVGNGVQSGILLLAAGTGENTRGCSCLTANFVHVQRYILN